MPSLFTTVSWPRGRAPRRAAVLDRVADALPWAQLLEALAPIYGQGSTGRPPYPLKVMLRVYVLQWLFSLSDKSTEDLILDSHSAASFAGIDPWQPRPPGETAVREFRHLMEEHNAGACVEIIRAALLAAGKEVRPGRIVEPVMRQRQAPR